MALPSSGQITLNQVNVELGNSGTAQIGLGDSAVRGLFGIASGEIEMADGYGKSSETVVSSSVQQMTVSSYISSGGTLRIASGVYIWSDSTSTAGMIIDIPCTIINEGYIIGKGGAGAAGVSSNAVANGNAGGPAVNVTSSGVTITNSSGAYIAGGGGGGAAASYYAQWQQGEDFYSTWRPSGGAGGGAGGGQGGANGGAGGAIGSVGSNGSGNSGLGGGAGGGAGLGYGDRYPQTLTGAGGGRILPGAGGGTNGYTGGEGGAAGASGTNNYHSGESTSGGGGGGWGASGGNATQGAINPGESIYTKTGTGGAGGAAITGTSRTLTNNGTVYGST